MKVFYFGTWGAAGHYIFLPSGHTAHPEKAGPWSPRDLDANGYEERLGGRCILTSGGFCPPDPKQPLGVWKLTHGVDTTGAWTAIGCWDRSCDQRLGSKAVFVAQGEHDEVAMREIADRHFPAVWARIQGGRA